MVTISAYAPDFSGCVAQERVKKKLRRRICIKQSTYMYRDCGRIIYLYLSLTLSLNI
jgi:hypothetical protein